jgi:hypothetical protein
MKWNNSRLLIVTSNYLRFNLILRVTADLEINDYPMHARKKVTESEFLCSITDMTNAEVKLRGNYIDPK